MRKDSHTDSNAQIPSVVIVVPIYQPTIPVWEQISLQQLHRVLGDYPRVFIAPESLSFDYGKLSIGFSVVRFPDEYFTDTAAYSRLMMSPEFYDCFASYEYMLLYQLDAFVFSDRLPEFCNMGYDYIGAPVYRFTPPWHIMNVSVGNGGFSLRNISAAQNMLAQSKNWLPNHPYQKMFKSNEDLFWGFCGVKKELDFRIPPPTVALEFAVQDDIMRAYRRMPEWMPFGCHYWNKPGY